jgi:hypothetical protein
VDCSKVVVDVDASVCNASACDYNDCIANHDDCDGQRSNGCECTCGTKRNERCCPGHVCNVPRICNVVTNKCN